MYKVFIDKGGYVQERESAKPTPFPVCLAIKYGNDLTAECPDFILSIEDTWVFVRTAAPLPVGTPVLLHFYIPPEDKLLAEVQGSVVPKDRIVAGYPEGMYIRLVHDARARMQDLEKYLDGRKHLIDQKA
jgi:hypothetical protein